MPILPWINMQKANEQGSGFTLLELSVAMFIMAILLGVSIPSFSNLFESQLEKETHKIAVIIDKLRLQAILGSESYQLVFDTKKSEYQVFTIDRKDPNIIEPHNTYRSPISLKSPIEFSKITTETEETSSTSLRFGGEKLEFDKIFGEKYEFRIDSSGFIDLFSLSLKDQSNSITLTIKNIMGDISISHETPL